LLNLVTPPKYEYQRLLISGSKVRALYSPPMLSMT
jgi:hypothetical protein